MRNSLWHAPRLAAFGLALAAVAVLVPADTACAAEPEAAHPGAAGEAERQAVKQYTIELSRVMSKLRRYPADELQQGHEGRVELHMEVASDGSARGIEIETSSGHRSLDLAAMRSMQQAARMTPVPALLRGTAFSVRVHVAFVAGNEEAPTRRPAPAAGP